MTPQRRRRVVGHRIMNVNVMVVVGVTGVVVARGQGVGAVVVIIIVIGEEVVEVEGLAAHQRILFVELKKSAALLRSCLSGTFLITSACVTLLNSLKSLALSMM